MMAKLLFTSLAIPGTCSAELTRLKNLSCDFSLLGQSGPIGEFLMQENTFVMYLTN